MLLTYNTLVVTTGATLLGVASGVVGTYTLLRRRALLSDALSHSTLPGICIAYLFLHSVGVSERSLAVLLLGAAAAGLVGGLTVQWIHQRTRVNEDAAIAISLSFYYGIGVVLLSIIQTLTTGSPAGLNAFIFGQAAAMSVGEAVVAGALSLLCVAVATILYKELQLYAFDPDFSQGQGWQVERLDALVIGLTVLVTVISLQVVGLVLSVALLIIPPVTARFWVRRLPSMLALSGLLGGSSALLGTLASSWFADLPTGGVIILFAGLFFLVSLVFSPRGLFAMGRRTLNARMRLLELRLLEAHQGTDTGRVWPESLSWSDRLGCYLVGQSLRRRGLLAQDALTESGRQALQQQQAMWQLWSATLTAPDPFNRQLQGLQWGIDDLRQRLTDDQLDELRLHAERQSS